MIKSFHIYLIFSLLCGVVSILGDHIGVGMLDYALFSMFIAISLVMTRKRFVVPKGYRLSAVIDSTFPKTYHDQYKSKDVTINCAGDHKKDYRLYYYESTSEMGISKVTIVKE